MGRGVTPKWCAVLLGAVGRHDGVVAIAARRGRDVPRGVAAHEDEVGASAGAVMPWADPRANGASRSEAGLVARVPRAALR